MKNKKLPGGKLSGARAPRSMQLCLRRHRAVRTSADPSPRCQPWVEMHLCSHRHHPKPTGRRRSILGGERGSRASPSPSLPGACASSVRSRVATKAGRGGGGGGAAALWRRATMKRRGKKKRVTIGSRRRWVSCCVVPCYPITLGWEGYQFCTPWYLIT